MAIRKKILTAMYAFRDLLLAGTTAAVTTLCVLGIKKAEELPPSAIREDLKEQYSLILRASNLLLVPYGIIEFFYALYLSGGGYNLDQYQRISVSTSVALSVLLGYYAVTIGPEQELLIAGAAAAGNMILANVGRRAATHFKVQRRGKGNAPLDDRGKPLYAEKKSVTATIIEVLKDMLVPGTAMIVGEFVNGGINKADSSELDPTGLKSAIQDDFARLSSVNNLALIGFSQIELFHAFFKSGAWKHLRTEQLIGLSIGFTLSVASGAWVAVQFANPQLALPASVATAGSVFFAGLARHCTTISYAETKREYADMFERAPILS